MNTLEIIKTFQDLIALLMLVIIIPGLWVAQALGLFSLAEQVNGALILAWGWILNHYFKTT